MKQKAIARVIITALFPAFLAACTSDGIAATEHTSSLGDVTTARDCRCACGFAR